MYRSRGELSWLVLLMTVRVLAEDGGQAQRQPETAAQTIEQVDALYPRRDEPAVAGQLNSLLARGLSAHPNDYGLLWRDARWLFWQADGAEGKSKQYLAKRGADAGDRAIEINPQGAEGHYFAGVSLGVYAQGVGVMSAISQGLEGKFVRNIDAAIEMAPQLENGGPLIAKGRYYYELPWPKRSLDKSEKLLREAIQKYPQNLRARYYLAETLLKNGQAKDAKETAAPIAHAQETYDLPEVRRVKSWTPALLSRIEEKIK